MSVIDFTRFEGKYLLCDTGKRRTNEWWQELSSETDIATISLVLYSLSRRDRAYSTDVARSEPRSLRTREIGVVRRKCQSCCSPQSMKSPMTKCE